MVETSFCNPDTEIAHKIFFASVLSYYTFYNVLIDYRRSAACRPLTSPPPCPIHPAIHPSDRRRMPRASGDPAFLHDDIAYDPGSDRQNRRCFRGRRARHSG
ncbi:MAG: hypothetical protein ACXIVE_06270, partial [Salinarimonas sp.]